MSLQVGQAMNVTLAIEEKVAKITLARLEQRNAISIKMWDQIAEHAEAITRSDAEVVILRGAGGIFCAGADLDELKELKDIDSAKIYWRRMTKALDAVANIPVPTIAVLERYCFGGGCLLAIACDLRYATTDTTFSIPVAKLGFILDTATIGRLIALVGPASAKEILFQGGTVDGDKALAHRLINGLYDFMELDLQIREIIKRILDANAGSIAQLKKTINQVTEVLNADASAQAEEETLIAQRFLNLGTAN
jgi:enoyl-CoA hydratase